MFCLKITSQGKSFKFDVSKEYEIRNVQPGIASVYDYYESQGSLDMPLNSKLKPLRLIFHCFKRTLWPLNSRSKAVSFSLTEL